MLIVLMLYGAGCLVFDGALAYEYDDFDDESYEDEDDMTLTSYSGPELTRIRRYSEPSRSQGPHQLEQIKDALHQILPGRRFDDWEEEFPNSDTKDINNSISQNDYYLTPIPTDHQVPHGPRIQDFQGRASEPDESTSEMTADREREELRLYMNSMTRGTELLLPEWLDQKTLEPIRTGVLRNSDTTSTVDTTPFPTRSTTTELATTGTLPLCVTTTATTTTTITTTTTKKTTRPFDIEKFLDIIANLTYDYYSNLTEQVNETLYKMGVPTCGTPTTTTMLPTTTESRPVDYAAMSQYLIGKCFVCGLEDPGIPYNADCADAFAGDFLPLVPQDPRAKRKIIRYKKYCRYKDVDNFVLNTTMPRSIFGRWTGGCSVRWTDLSGVYTQRACRNRRQAAVGRHFASHRMARLEMTLASMDNGCIISPVASLLPLSRGISLFARFHACVCTGNWCNLSARPDSDVRVTALITMTAVMIWLNGLTKNYYALR